MIECKVLVLDGEEHIFEVSKSNKVQDLFNVVCQKLEIVEKEYFGLVLEDKKTGKIWLNNSKKLGKYVVNGICAFSLEVKLYPPEPDMLQNESTRYQLFLQLRRDILSERLPCSFLTLALLGSYAAQYDLGDYDPAVHGKDLQYLRNISFAPKQTQELLEKIQELYITHRGQSPEEALQDYLDNAKKLSLYGVHMRDAKDLDNEDVQIGVCAAGLLIFKHRLRIHRFVWAKIIKILYKRNIFTIRIRPAEHEKLESTFAFKLPSYQLAKRLWRLAVEHHTFFRLKGSNAADRGTFPRFSSKHRLSGNFATYRTSKDGVESQPGNIRRGGQLSRSVEGLAGFSTERAEQYQEDNRPPGATLTLKGRHKGSLPLLDREDVDQSNDGSSYDGRRKAEQWQKNQNFDMYGTMSSNHSVGSYPTNPNDPQYRYTDVSTNPYRIGDGYNNNKTSHPYQRLAVGEDDDDDDDELPPYQEDRLTEKHGGCGSTNGQWNTQPSSTQVKTSTRTYIGPDGAIVTEHRREREGVIETQMRRVKREKREKKTSDFDYDKALSDAILAVTNVNTDMTVEKIEIQTKEEQQRSYYDTDDEDNDLQYGGPGETVI